MRSGDAFVVVLLACLLALWLFARGRNWYWRPRASLLVPRQEEIYIPSAEVVELLQTQGYEIIAGKHKLPVSVTLDGRKMETRLFIDAYVLQEEQLYIVKVARDRQPLDMTSSGIRERLLVYQLLYPDAAGVLYVEPASAAIHHIQFEIQHDR